MEKKLSKIAAALFITVFLLGVFPAIPVKAKNADSMWIAPSAINLSTDTTPVNYNFTILVWLNISSTDFFGYQIGLHYNRTYLQCVQSKFTYDFVDAADLNTTVPPLEGSFAEGGPTIDTSGLGNGSILAFQSCKGNDFISCHTSADGYRAGTLINATFMVIKFPGKGETLSAKFDISKEYPSSTWAKNPALEAIALTVYDADYSFAWKQPTSTPHLEVSPTLTEFGPEPPTVVGQAFDIKVYIANLDLAWGLTNVSFTLSYNQTLIDILGSPPEANVTFNTAKFDGTNEATVGSGSVDIIARTSLAVSAPPNLLVCTITFTVMHQVDAPPYPGYPWAEISPLDISDYQFFDHTLEINGDSPVNGQVKIYGLRTLELAWLEVRNSTIVRGPAAELGNTFTVDILCKNLDKGWKAVGFQFRLQFNGTLLQVASVEEGEFWKDPIWNLHGTFFFTTAENDPIYGWNVICADILLPNGTGDFDQTEYPNTNNVTARVLASITFEIVYQGKSPCTYNGHFLTCPLHLIAFWNNGDEAFIDQDGNYIPSAYNKYVHGFYKIFDTPFYNGRFIDLYGGAWNAGYGAYPFPAPYGGQGMTIGYDRGDISTFTYNMDLAIPQSEVKFFAHVEYNCWPVQSKDVGFEIEGPFEKLYDEENDIYYLSPKQTCKIWAKLTARTDENGTATIVFRMPWPCVDPESLTGIWLVTASVNVADVVVTDALLYYYEHMVYITKVNTDKTYYNHGESVVVTVDFHTHSMQKYPVLFSVVITDELGVPFGFTTWNTTFGWGQYTFCTWKEGEFVVEIPIPKWAFAGLALVHVSAYDKDPTEGGFAYGQEYTPLPEIWIMPL